MGVVVLFLMVVETFALGHFLAKVKDLKEENELLRDTLPHWHSSDWGDVLEVSDCE